MSPARPKSRSKAPAAAPPEGDDLVELGRRLHAARDAAHISAGTLADMAGISAAYVRILESAENKKTGRPSKPSPTVLVALCQALGLDIDEIFPLAGLKVSDAQAMQVQRINAARGATSEAIRNIQAAVDSIADRGPFMTAQMQTRLRRFSLEMGLMSRGILRVDPEHEPTVADEAAKSCQHHLRAVSFQDEEWWAGDDGAQYLNQQQELRAREVEITRVFLFKDESELAQYRDAFQRHLDLGIETYVLRIAAVPARLHSDIVIYDDALMRRAFTEDISGGGKAAEFSDDLANVNQALYDFEELVEIAANDPGSVLDAVLQELGRDY